MRGVSNFLKSFRNLSIPVLVIVYINDIETIQEGMKLQVTDFIIKPVNWPLMKMRLSNVLTNHRMNNDYRKINTRFTQVQRMSGVGTWEIGDKNSEIICSEGISFILGMSQHLERMALKQFLRFVHPDDRDDISALLRQAINRLYPFKRDHRILLSDGTEKIVDHQVFMVVDKGTKKRKVVGTIQDITARNSASIWNRIEAVS